MRNSEERHIVCLGETMRAENYPVTTDNMRATTQCNTRPPPLPSNKAQAFQQGYDRFIFLIKGDLKQ